MSVPPPTARLAFREMTPHDLDHIGNLTRSARGTTERPGTNVKAKAGLNRSILGMAWGKAGRMLAYKCALHGGMLVTVDPRNSSRECARCGLISVANRLDQANFRCAACKLVTNADTNAARVILRRGLTALSGATPGCGGTAREASTCRTVNRLSIASSTGWHEGIRNPRLEGRGGHQHTTVTSSTSTTRARPPCPRPGCTTPPSRERPRARPRRR
jgi:Putative transposase DNA-binding domain